MAYTDIDKPTDYFDISTWTATTSAISNLDFSPDWVWIKSTDSGNGHILFDTIRGANIRLSTAVTSEEFTVTDELMSFDSNGYTLGSSGNTNDTNPFNASYVGWSWRGSDSSAVSNTDGSITSTVSANTTSGFSVVTWTGNGSNGATIGHGLGDVPKMMIFKIRSTSDDWTVYHTTLGAGKKLNLNDTGAESTVPEIFNNTEPTSSLITFGTHSRTNTNGANYVGYIFAEKKGFSKFGSFVGNGNANGTFVYTGFSPSFVMLKRTNTTGSWTMYDNKRHTYNPNGEYLLANTNGAAVAFDNVDFLSNGFKLRDASFNNGSGDTIIYMCFAENPFTTSTGIPTTAR